MKTVAIAIDDWKLAIFEQELERAGYEFKTSLGVTDDSLIISVKTRTIAEIKPVVERANTRARDERS